MESQQVRIEETRLQNMVKAGKHPSYKDFDTNIYGAADVRLQLRIDQHDKCMYCECTLLDKDGGEVEHYRPKTAVRQDQTPGNTTTPAYHQLAYVWDNLALSCHACNRRKSTLFPLRNPYDRFDLSKEDPLIINPYKKDPAEHIEFRRHKVYPQKDKTGKDDKEGKTTIEILELNRLDLVELRRRRFQCFLDIMTNLNLSFDEALEKVKQDAIRDFGSSDGIEFLGMFENQIYKF